jgi:sialate O-acetylesterase
MVLQETLTSGRETFIWGLASPGSKITLSGLPGALNISSMADAVGAWSIPVKAGYSGPHDLTLMTSHGDSTTAAQAYFGDVLICSGQSNLVNNLPPLQNVIKPAC